MDLSFEEGEIISKKIHTQEPSQRDISSCSSQEQSESDRSSSLKSWQSQGNIKGNIANGNSSFKKHVIESQDLKNSQTQPCFICALHNFTGECHVKECKKKHIKASESELKQLIHENLEMLAGLAQTNQKLIIPKQLYSKALEEYISKKSKSEQQCRILENNNLNHPQNDFNRLYMTPWQPSQQQYQFRTLQSMVGQAQQKQPELPNNNGFTPLLQQQTMFQSNTYSVNGYSHQLLHPIIKPQPQLDFKQLTDLVEKQATSVELVNNFKRDLMARLKTEVEKMQDKLRVITFLKKCVRDQQVEENEFLDIYYTLNPFQQLHFLNFFKIIELQQPTIQYQASEEQKQIVKSYFQNEKTQIVRNLLVDQQQIHN